MPSLDVGIYENRGKQFKTNNIGQVGCSNDGKVTLRPVHLHAKYIQKQATFSDENLTQKFEMMRLLVAVK